MVGPGFTPRRFTRGNQPNPIAAQGVDHDKQSPCAVHAERDEPRLAYGIRVVACQGARIAERGLGIGERDPVLAGVGGCFAGIEFDIREEYAYYTY